MKTNLRILTLIGVLSAGLFTATAADKPAKAPPGGGRRLENTEPHAEFVVEKDRSVTINFYNHDMKPVAVTTQSVTVQADANDGKAKLEFEKKGDSLVSKTKLPEGDGYNVIVPSEGWRPPQAHLRPGRRQGTSRVYCPACQRPNDPSGTTIG